MRVGVVLLVSIVLNVALVAAFLGWYTPFHKDSARLARPITTALVNSNNVKILKTNVLVRPRLFSWQEIESGDYPTYIQNLRGIGMPEPTIRDIIIADVDQLMVRKRRELAAQQDSEWWRSTPSAEYQSNALAHAFALEEERTALLTKLLGANWKKERLDQQPDPLPLTGPVLGALPDDVKKNVQDIVASSGEQIRRYLAENQAANQQPDVNEIAKLREKTREQLAKVLNSQQLEEFLLRNSYNASQLRRDLQGMEVSPEEFRGIFRAVDAIDRDLQVRYAGNDAESLRQRAALQQQRLNTIRDAIGDDRFDTFTMLHDPSYQDALAVAQKAGGSEEAAAALYEIQRATADELDRIRSDPTLSDAEKQEQMRETQLEQQRARALVLGEPPPAESRASATPSAPQFQTHVTFPGETLGQISVQYGIGISAIRAANPGVDINRLPAGSVINVPWAGPPAPPLPYPPGVNGR